MEPNYTALTPEEQRIWQMGYDKRDAELKPTLNLTVAAEGKGTFAELVGRMKAEPAKTLDELRAQIEAMEVGRELLPAEWAYVPTEPLLSAIGAYIEGKLAEAEAKVKAMEAAAGEAVGIFNDIINYKKGTTGFCFREHIRAVSKRLAAPWRARGKVRR